MSHAELQTLLDAFLTDVTSMNTAITALIADHNTLRTKLNADAGVTDTDYAASTATATTLTVTT